MILCNTNKRKKNAHTHNIHCRSHNNKRRIKSGKTCKKKNIQQFTTSKTKNKNMAKSPFSIYAKKVLLFFIYEICLFHWCNLTMCSIFQKKSFFFHKTLETIRWIQFASFYTQIDERQSIQCFFFFFVVFITLKFCDWKTFTFLLRACGGFFFFLLEFDFWPMNYAWNIFASLKLANNKFSSCWDVEENCWFVSLYTICTIAMDTLLYHIRFCSLKLWSLLVLWRFESKVRKTRFHLQC